MMPQTKDQTDGIWLLDNPIMNYSWGSTTAISELLGKPSDPGKPQAEMWIGAHPKAPSLARGTGLSVADLIRQDPKAVLGPAVAETFGNKLPFLFKVLASRHPLSIQVHPQRERACQGYEAENRRGLAPDGPERNYRDPNHKPECICALTRFWGLCGFRPVDQSLGLLKRACPGLSRRLTLHGAGSGQAAIGRFWADLLRLPADGQKEVIDEALAWKDQGPERRWIGILAHHYPGDIGIVAPLLLNLFRLEPGQALFLRPGTLHAYLEGVGVEVMANSDNVIRAGLTPKHKDIDELMNVVDFRSTVPEVLAPVRVSATETVYCTPAKEFRLGTITLVPGRNHHCRQRNGCEVLLCVRGRAQIRHCGHDPVLLVRGDAVLIGAVIMGYELSGEATVYKVDVPAADDVPS